MSSRPSVIVVGTGIVGAAIAFNLASAGHTVTMIAADAVPQASAGSFAWINAGWGNGEAYVRLRLSAMAEWPVLAGRCPGIALSQHGGLSFDLDAEDLASYQRQHAGWGYDIRLVGRDEIAAIEPGLALSPDVAVHVRSEGAAEPVRAARALVAGACSHGARLVNGCVPALVATDGRVRGVRIGDEDLIADEVVLAAGIGTDALARSVGFDLPLVEPPGLIVHSQPAERMLEGVVIAPGLHMRQTADGRVIAGSSFGGSDPGEDPDRTAAELFDTLRAALRQGRSLALDTYTIARRPTPKDGLPVIGRVAGIDGLYLAVMHSGVTNAPAVGLFAARELGHAGDEPLLVPFRPSRFQAAARV